MNSDRICCTKMMRLMADNAAILAIPIKRRDTEASRRRLAAMQTMLDETFIVWPQHALHIINNDEDRAFLRSMMGDRLATFGVRDEKLAGTVRQQQTDRQTRHTTSEIATPIDDDDDEDAAGIVRCRNVARRGHSTAIAQSPPVGAARYVRFCATRHYKAVETRRSGREDEDDAGATARLHKGSDRGAGGDVTKLASSYATVDRTI